ncbi:MAG: flagellar export protein FliJ [Oscillospiraceae bacterium]|nr:flagellar export protein FliJ [Oscillospiraceae bacterium]
MKKFKFTLKSLLDLKLAMERQQKAELAEARARRDRFVRGLMAMEVRFDEQRREYGRVGGPACHSPDLALRDMGFRALFFHMDEQKERIRVAKEEGDRIQKKLIGLMTDRKILEKLREKQRERHREELQREEAAMIDDFLTNQLRS